MVANPDLVVVVFSCDRPPPNPRLIDRFLVVAEYNEVPALLVANKVDLVGAEPAPASSALSAHRLRRGLREREGRIGLDELRERLAGQPVDRDRTVGRRESRRCSTRSSRDSSSRPARSRRRWHKGRHTTTHAELHPLDGPDGGYVADTPGHPRARAVGDPPTELASCFPEFRDHLGACAFNDCTHLHEPRCGLRAAVAAGPSARTATTRTGACSPATGDLGYNRAAPWRSRRPFTRCGCSVPTPSSSPRSV